MLFFDFAVHVMKIHSRINDTHYNATFEGANGIVPCDSVQLRVEGELAPVIEDADSTSHEKPKELFDAAGNAMRVARVVRVVGSSDDAPEPEAPKEKEVKRKLWLQVYAMNNFRKQSRTKKSGGLFKKNDYEQFDVAERLSYTKDSLTDSLMELGDDAQLNDEAVEVFSMIQKIMGDYPSTKHPDLLSYELLAKVSAKKELRDELYCQLAKQVR